MITNYKNTEFQLYGYLIQLRELFKTNNIAKFQIEKIDKNIKLIESRNFNVAVMGEFKRGKSSLINALLGIKILPSDVTPATATINRITYGTEPSMMIFYYDGKTEVVDIDNIVDYVTMLTEEGIKRQGQIREVVIQYPTVLCQNHVDIIDTPGLNDNIEMTKVTMNMLCNIDAVIVVVSALSPFSDKENEFVCQLIKSDNIENVIFVVTFIDQIDEDEQDKFITYIHNRICKNVLKCLEKENNLEEILIKSKRLLDNSKIFGISSLFALKSFVTGNRELLKKSRFEMFKTELYEFLTSQQGVNMIIKAIKVIRSSSKEFEKLCNDRISELENDLYVINEKMKIINNYCNEYINKFESAFEIEEKHSKELLNSILELKVIFMNNFKNSLDKIEIKEQNKIINIVSSEAARCWNIANEEVTGKIKKQIFDIFTSAINNYCNIRNSELVEPIQELDKLCNLNWKSSDSFDRNINDIMISFGFPRFNWQASTIPSSQHLYNYNLLNNAQYAINVSVEKLYEHWNIYINVAKKWWINQAYNEALLVAEMLNNSVNVSREEKIKQLFLLKNAFSKQKITIQDIRNNTNLIFNEIY